MEGGRELVPSLSFPVRDIVKLIVLGLRYVVIQPFFWIVVAITFFQYRRLQNVEKSILGVVRESAFVNLLLMLGLGLIGGLIGSFIFAFVGISVSDAGIFYLWIVALLLMLIQPRFMCFAYSAGVVGLFSIVTGTSTINIPAVLGIVAVLHMVESLLIYVSGYAGAIPVPFERPDGKTVGGFALQRIWPIPIMVLIIGGLAIQEEVMEGLITMPEWWPLIGTIISAPEGHELVYSMWPFAVGAGYSDIALTRYPRERARATALTLAVYSILLLVTAILADRIMLFQVIGVLMAPLGHEIVIILGQNAELRGKPLFVSPPDGVMILDVLPGSQGDKLELCSGDIIKRVNGVPVTSNDEFQSIVQMAQFFLSMDVESHDDSGHPIGVTKEFKGNPGKLGILLVPESTQRGYVKFADSSFLRRFWRKIRNLFMGR